MRNLRSTAHTRSGYVRSRAHITTWRNSHEISVCGKCFDYCNAHTRNQFSFGYSVLFAHKIRLLRLTCAAGISPRRCIAYTYSIDTTTRIYMFSHQKFSMLLLLLLFVLPFNNILSVPFPAIDSSCASNSLLLVFLFMASKMRCCAHVCQQIMCARSYEELKHRNVFNGYISAMPMTFFYNIHTHILLSLAHICDSVHVYIQPFFFCSCSLVRHAFVSHWSQYFASDVIPWCLVEYES